MARGPCGRASLDLFVGLRLKAGPSKGHQGGAIAKVGGVRVRVLGIDRVCRQVILKGAPSAFHGYLQEKL